MKKTIYIRLLNEGVNAYRPVNSSFVTSNTFIVGGADIYDADDEEWEFTPEARVVVESGNLEGEVVLVAVSEAAA